MPEGEESLYDLSSIHTLTSICRQWGRPQVLSTKERDLRRRQIEVHLDAVVALPERVNTESAIEIFFNTSAIVALVNSAWWERLSFVFDVATRQLAASLRSEESCSRWLKFHVGGMDMIECELLRLFVLLRDAHIVCDGDPNSVRLCRSLCAVVISNLLENTYCWQNEVDVTAWWDKLESTMPKPGYMFTLLSALMNECVSESHYRSRSLLDSKTEQEETYGANCILFERLIILASACVLHPQANRCGSHINECFSVVSKCILIPWYKSREFRLISVALRSLLAGGSITSSLLLAVLKTCFDQISSSVFQFQIPSKDTLKRRWSERTSNSLSNEFPFWHADSLFQLICCVVQCCGHCSFLVEMLTLIVTKIPSEIVDDVYSEALLQSCLELQRVPFPRLFTLFCGTSFTVLVRQLRCRFCKFNHSMVSHFPLLKQLSTFLDVFLNSIRTTFLELDNAQVNFLKGVIENIEALQIEVLDSGVQLTLSFDTFVLLWRCSAIASLILICGAFPVATRSPQNAFSDLRRIVLDVTAASRVLDNFEKQQSSRSLETAKEFVRLQAALSATATWRKMSEIQTAPDGYLSLMNEALEMS